MKRKICNVEFDVLSPSHYKRDDLELLYAGQYHRWCLMHNGVVDLNTHPSKEHAVHHLICTYHNFG